MIGNADDLAMVKVADRYSVAAPIGLSMRLATRAIRWEEDPILDRVWWLMKYDIPNHGFWGAGIAATPDGLFRGFLVTDSPEDDFGRYPAFPSLEEAKVVLEVEAKLDGAI